MPANLLPLHDDPGGWVSLGLTVACQQAAAGQLSRAAQNPKAMIFPVVVM